MPRRQHAAPPRHPPGVSAVSVGVDLVAWQCPASRGELTNVMLYWLTGTAGLSARMYYEDVHAGHAPAEPTTLAVAVFATDFQSIRRFADRDHANIVHWSEFDRGGHYSGKNIPDLLTEDLRTFFAKLR